MAILNGLIQKMKGSAGQFTFKSLNGQTVVSEKPAKVSTLALTSKALSRLFPQHPF